MDNNKLISLKKSTFAVELAVSENQTVSAWEVYKTLFPGQRSYSRWVEINILERESLQNGNHYFGIDDNNCSSSCKYEEGEIQYKSARYKNINLTLDTAKFLAAKSNSKLGDALVWYLIEVENKLKQLRIEKDSLQIPRTYKEALLALVEAEEQKEKLALTAVNLKTALDDLHDWVSIIKVATHNKVSEKAFNWRELKLKSDMLGYVIKKAASPRFGYQNLYHVNVFKAVYPRYDYNFGNDFPDLKLVSSGS